VHSQQEGGQTQEGVPRPQVLLGFVKDGVGESWKTGLSVINSQRMGYVLLIPPVCWAVGVFGLGWSDWGYHFLWALEASGQQDPAVCQSHSVSISSLECDSLSISKPWHSAIRFSNSLISP
jgi:hypothetical protein